MPAPKTDPDVLSYLAVRRALGLLGLALPIMLYVSARPLGRPMQPSISEFYHTAMGDVLVGCLTATGVFLLSYLGYPRQSGETLSDRWVARAAGLGVLGVALFPVVPPGFAECTPGAAFVAGPVQGFTGHWCAYPALHALSAATFFVAMMLFCFFLFPRGDRKPDGSIDWSTPRNRLYLACGIALAVSILSLAAMMLAGDETQAALNARNVVFWGETLGVFAFGISWLAKGRIVEGVRALITDGGGLSSR